MKIVVTGATGYIGSRLVNIGEAHGYVIVSASRLPPENPTVTWIPFNFHSSTHITLPVETAAVVHLAANTLPVGDEDVEREIQAAKYLIQSTKESGAKFIFVSSQTARPDAPTAYGRTKWFIEKEVLSSGGWVVRPGQVYGGPLRGLFGTLVTLVRQLPALPLFIPAPKIQPIHVDDLSEGLLRIVEREDLPSDVYCLAAPEPISFSKFLGEIAQSRLRIRRGFVPAPIWIINAFAPALGESLRTKFGLERLRSLFDLPVMVTASDLELLELDLRPLRSGMHKSGNDRRRCLLQEGSAFFKYVLKASPGGALLRRYARAIESLRGGEVLGLPQSMTKFPVLLALIDRATWQDQSIEEEFKWRLNSATLLAEATPLGAHRFLGLGSTPSVFRSLIIMTYAITCDVFWRICRVIFSPILRLTKGCMVGTK